MIEGKQWTFCVAEGTSTNEVVCIVGSCEELGSWDPCRIIPLESSPLGDTDQASEEPQQLKWTVTLQLPLSKIGYRYCVAIRSGDVYAIRRWETHFNPRCIETQHTCTGDISQFGLSCGQRRVELGWLVYDTAVQLKLCNTKSHPKPVVLWKKKHINKKVRIKVTPVSLSRDGIASVVEDTTEQGTDAKPTLSPISWPLLEVAVLKEGLSSFGPQSQFGMLFDEDDFTVFQCRLLQLHNTAFLLDFYVEEAGAGDIPMYIGCSYLLPSNLDENFGVTTLPITSPRHLPIGQLTVHYMVVKPMPLGMSDMSASFTRYWKDSWKGLEVGHRGAGNSYHSQPKSCATIRENTVASFKYAAENGADMVEIDVQLSRDFVPVIYHDFHACIALKRKKDQRDSDLLEIPIKDLTVQQLHALKVYHKTEKGLSKFSDEELEDHQPFPTLEKSLKTVPYTCGFNVEVKWTMLLKDGTMELLHPFELNNFLDLILKVVLEHGGRRKIVFSCFHPDICTMLRLKQNRYPVLFLTQGMSEDWPPYDDLRCQTIRQAVLYATAADILGINLQSGDLLRDVSQMDLALQNNLIVFCWGDQNNDRSNIALLKSLGMHAVIYDKIDVYNSKKEKESIFLCEERQSSLENTQQMETNENGTASTAATSLGAGSSGAGSPGSGTDRSADHGVDTARGEATTGGSGGQCAVESNMSTNLSAMLTAATQQ